VLGVRVYCCCVEGVQQSSSYIGGLGLIVNVIAPELPPPGVGVNTVTRTVLGVLPGPAVKTSAADIVASSCVALTYAVALSLPSHRTTEHGTNELPVTLRVNVGEPAVTLVCDNELMLGAGRFVAGVVVVKVTVFDVPAAFDAETRATPGNATSVAKIEAVSRAELPKVVWRGKPFQFTAESFVKFEPFTVNVKPLAWQYGVDESEDDGAETDVITGAGPAVAPILKTTRLDTSLVVVAVVLEDPETAEPGICTATCTAPADVKFEAGTIAVSCVLLTNVVVSWI
jgi:hypothetical protein